MDRLTDNALAHLVTQGNHRAFRVLFDRHYSALCAFAAGICEDGSEAEDVVQNFFLELWDKHATLTIRYTFKAYAFRAVHNRALNHRQRAQPHRMQRIVDGMEEIPDRSPTPDELQEFEANLNRLELAIDRLPGRCRQVFSLVYLEGMPYAKAAETLGLSLNTVKVQMGRAYKRIREQVVI